MWKADTLVQALNSCPYWTRWDLNSCAILGFDVFIRTFAIAFHTWNRREKAEQRQSFNIFKSASKVVLPSRQPSLIYYVTSTKEQFSTSTESHPSALWLDQRTCTILPTKNLNQSCIDPMRFPAFQALCSSGLLAFYNALGITSIDSFLITGSWVVC